jgi:hypothetical protein
MKCKLISFSSFLSVSKITILGHFWVHGVRVSVNVA